MLLFTRGWFHHRAGDSHPGASRIKDVLTAQHSTLCSPKRGSKSGSSATAATPARVLQGEGNKQLGKKKYIVLEGNSSGKRERDLLSQHRNRAHVGTAGYLS